MLLQLIRLVLIVGLLRPYVEAATDQRICVYVVDDISIHPLHDFVRGQASQQVLAYRSVCRADDESGGRQKVLTLLDPLLLRLAGGQPAGPGKKPGDHSRAENSTRLLENSSHDHEYPLPDFVRG